MSRTIPLGVPKTLISGDTWEFDYSESDFPGVDGWSLTFALRGPTDFTSTAGHVTVSGDTYQVRIPASATALEAGPYRYIVYFTRAAERVTVEQGALNVQVNPLAGVNRKTHAEVMLELITARLEGRAASDLESYQVEGHAVNKIPFAELRKARGEYARMVRRQRNGGRLMRTVEVTFVEP